VARERYYELDVARFLAAIMVVFYHYAFASSAAGNATVVAFPKLGSLSQYGYLGVEFFFMISGFVILMTAIGKTPKQFVISRFVRLYPNYWLGVLITFLVLTFVGHPKYSVTPSQFLVNLTMLQSFLDVPHIDGVYWSLVVELKFYLLTFVAMCLGILRFRRTLLVVWLVIAAIITSGVRIPVVGYFLIPQWAGFFVAGCTFFLIRRFGPSPSLLGIAAASFALALWSSIERGAGLEERLGIEFSTPIIVIYTSVFFLFFLLFSLDKLSVLKRPEFVTLGALTYPIYIIHQRVGYVLLNNLGETMPRFAALGTTLAVMLFVSWGMHRWFERPFTPVVRRFLQRVTSRVPGGVSS